MNGPWRFTISLNIVRWQPDLVRILGWQSCAIGHGPSGYLAIRIGAR